MLGNLIKYEFRYSAKIIPVFYIAYAGIVLIVRLLIALAQNVNEMFAIPALMSFLPVLLGIGAIMLIPFILGAVRFYKNLLGDEGYLSFTLPVTPRAHIAAKTITYIIWYIASLALTVGSVFLLIQPVLGDFMMDISKELSVFVPEADMAELRKYFGILIIGEVVIYILNALASLGQIFVSFSIGQLVNKMKVLLAVGVYLGIGLITDMIPVFTGFIMSSVNAEAAGTMTSISDQLRISCTGLPVTMGISAVLFIVYFIVSDVILTRRLNLE